MLKQQLMRFAVLAYQFVSVLMVLLSIIRTGTLNIVLQSVAVSMTVPSRWQFVRMNCRRSFTFSVSTCTRWLPSLLRRISAQE